MAAPINKAKFTQDINAPIKAVYGGGLMFSKDNLSNVISVDIVDNGQPFEVTGTVAGTVIRSDGTTIPVNTGAISGNTVSLTLTEACFDVPGQIVVNIIVTNGDVKCCVLRAVYTVVPTETSAVVDPGNILPSIADLIDDIDAAVASIPADYSGLLASIAGTFSPSKPYITGEYVWNDGTLYRFTADHAAGSWTGSDATAVTIGGELADLKSAITSITDTDEISISSTLNARINSGAIASASYARLAYAALNDEKQITVTKDKGKRFAIGFTDTTPANGVAVSGAIFNNTATQISSVVPTGAKYLVVAYYNTNDGETETAEEMLASIRIVGVVSALDSVARGMINQTDQRIEQADLNGLVAFKDDTGVKRASYNLFNGNLNVGYIQKNGTVNEGTTYRHTDKIDIHDLIGQTVKVYNDGTQKYIRFVCIYDENNTVKSSLGSDTNSLTFTIPSGAYYAVFSFTNSSVNTPYVLITTAENKTVYVPNENKWEIKDFPAVDAFVNIAEPLVLSADSLADDGELKAKTGNSVKTYGTYAMFCRPGIMTDDEYIIFGKNGSNGYAVGISKTKWAWFVNGSNQGGGTHGLTVKDYLFVTVNKVPGTGAVLTIYTNGGVYTRTNTSWQDYHGLQYIKNESGDAITEVKMTWGSSAFRNGIWFFGDSYTSGSDARWPYYISQLGFSGNILINGYPGEETDIGYKDFIDCIKYGKPTIAVWCLGMNNGDSGAINATWLKYTQAFLDVCELFDITPILATIPCCPLADHQYKNAWVRASGYRYIEFANVVNVTENSTTWYDGMLSSDNIHPTAQGAKALASQIIVSVPEIVV